MTTATDDRAGGATALAVVSADLAPSGDDPRALLLQVLRAAAEHLGSTWTVIALRRAALPGVQDRLLALGPDGRVATSDPSLPGHLRAQLRRTQPVTTARSGSRDGWVQVPIVVDHQVVGRLIAGQAGGVDSTPIEPSNDRVLALLADQAALALRTAAVFTDAADLRARAQELCDENARRSRDLLDAERRRIALELHDSVAQYVLSAGYAVDVCRAEAADREPGGETALRLTNARDLIATAEDQVRSVIYALNNEPGGGEAASLTQLVRGIVARHRHDLDIGLCFDGPTRALPPEVVRGLARICGEALFNVVMHAKADRAEVHVRYRAGSVILTVSDDGTGDARELRRLLRLERRGDADGRHQGLAGMARRADALGGRFTVRDAPCGGVRIRAAVPLADDSAGAPTS